MQIPEVVQKLRGGDVAAILWGLAAGPLYLLLLRTRTDSGRNVCGAIAALLALGAAVGHLRGLFLGRRRSTWLLLLLVTNTIIALVVLWNIFFWHYIRSSGYAHDNFRLVYHTRHAPIYGGAERVLPRFMIWPILAAGTALALTIFFRRRFSAGRISAWWLVLMQLLLTVGFDLSDGTRHIGPQVPPHLVPTPMGVTWQTSYDILHNYVGQMSLHQARFAHYPPGFVLFHEVLLRRLHIDRFTHLVVVLLVCLTPLPLAALARELGLERAAAQLGLLLFCTAIGVLVYARSDFAAVAMPLTATCLWLLMRGIRTGEWWAGILLGVTFAAFLMLAFTALFVGLLMAIIVMGGLLNRSMRLTGVVKTVLISGAVCLAIFAAVHMWSGFNIYECLRTARANEKAEQGSGFDDPTRYSLRSSQHLLAYLAGSGFATTALALLALPVLWRAENRLLASAGFALAATILFAGLGGAFHGETERVWLFFTPLLALVAGFEWHRRIGQEGRGLLIGVVVVVLLGNCAQELLYKHQSRNLRKEPRLRAVQMQPADDAE